VAGSFLFNQFMAGLTGSIRRTGPAAELRDDTTLRDRLLAL
jgi:hypothetical protein